MDKGAFQRSLFLSLCDTLRLRALRETAPFTEPLVLKFVDVSPVDRSNPVP